MTTANTSAKAAQLRLTRRSPAYWRVTIDNPPINVMGPEMVRQFQEVISSLEAEEFSAALLHEVSHASSRDPLRLLWMAACPDFLQVLGIDEAWRRAFSRACEFAADADAHRGSPEVALDLASALLKVARLRAVGPLALEGTLDVAVSSAFHSRVDLQARVEALASPANDSSATSSMPTTSPSIGSLPAA